MGLGFMSVNDPEAAQLAILPGNGTIPPGEAARYAYIAQGNAAAIARAKQLIPGLSNSALMVGGIGLLVVVVLMGGRRR